MTATKPRVHVIATGGTISSIGPHRLDYTEYVETTQRLTAAQLLERIPEARDIADVTHEDMSAVSSGAIGPSQWLDLARHVNGLFSADPALAGVVITHGTSTLEETAYFLHLAVKTAKPVVLTGAMRPVSSVSSDGDLNLLDAVRVAASPSAAGRGVLGVLNNEICSARDAMKMNTFRVETFKPGELGFLGYVDSDGRVLFYRNVDRAHTVATPFDPSRIASPPRVDVVYAYTGMDATVVDAIAARRPAGLVLAGYGGGTFPSVATEAAARIVAAGAPVVLATRVPSGRVINTSGKAARGFLVCDNLLPGKARILLMLALTVTNDHAEIQRMFDVY
ncbi:MAG: asparaginase [SAR202 cluster bacterium]|nr:asparaginase [SAR202 cluster bacterium]